jgi:hypothetical protein
MDYAWTCGCCGKQYNTLPLAFAWQAPANWFAVPEAEQAQRVKMTDDVCIIDDRELCVRGCLDVPVHGLSEPFSYGVWVSVSRESFLRFHELWDAQVRNDEPPMFGWLCNTIPIYPETISLKTNLHLRNDGLRPAIELEPTDHPLAVEQRNGISLDRVQEIIAALSHKH